MLPILFLIGLPGLLIFIDFLGFIFTGRQILNSVIFRITEVCSMIILPFIYGSFGSDNDCCQDDMSTAVFSPDHQLTIGVIIVICLICYFYSSYRRLLASPIVEICINSFLIIGVILNIFIAIHTKEFWLAAGGNIPVILLGLLMLIKNQKLFVKHSSEKGYVPSSSFERTAWGILSFQPILKFPILLIICLPILLILTAILLLTGQKPDSLIRAFTDTYKHGLSQWDYKCDNVACGGHYLCSVAANGHKKIVKPERLGIRNGNNIICNRQLLISNAFEDLLQEKFPAFHKRIRKEYDKIGDLVHCYYNIFNNKFVSDFIFIIMKPLEWFFLIVLYTFDKNPENRIGKQYLDNSEKQQIEAVSKMQNARQ